MKNRLLSTVVFCATSLFGLVMHSGHGVSQTKIENPQDDSACAEDNQCVIFEVSIKMATTVTAPKQKVSSGVVNLPGNFAGSYGSTVTRSGNQCTKQVRVPREIFLSVINMMKSLSSEGGQPPAFTPAQQTMILFYTTLMQQTLQFQCTQQDLAPSVVPPVSGDRP